jgi:hypothetical protein
MLAWRTQNPGFGRGSLYVAHVASVAGVVASLAAWRCRARVYDSRSRNPLMHCAIAHGQSSRCDDDDGISSRSSTPDFRRGRRRLQRVETHRTRMNAHRA